MIPKVNKIDQEWLENNEWAAQKPMFSYQEIMELIDNVENFEYSVEGLKIDLKNALLTKAYEEVYQKKKEAFRKEQQELGDRLLFGDDLEKFKESLGEPGLWTNLPQTGTEKEIFAAFRTRLFMWYAESIDPEDLDVSRGIAFVNSVAGDLGDPTLEHLTKEDSHGTGKHRADCPDC